MSRPTNNGTTSNADYDSGLFFKTITFPAASGSNAHQTVNIAPTPDNLVEGDEKVTLTLKFSAKSLKSITYGTQVLQGI